MNKYVRKICTFILIEFKRRLAPIRDHFEKPDRIQSRELVKIRRSYELKMTFFPRYGSFNR